MHGSAFLLFRGTDSMPTRLEGAAESRPAIAARPPHAAKIVGSDRQARLPLLLECTSATLKARHAARINCSSWPGP